MCVCMLEHTQLFRTDDRWLSCALIALDCTKHAAVPLLLLSSTIQRFILVRLSLCHKTNLVAEHLVSCFQSVCVYPSFSLWTKPCCSYSSSCRHTPKAAIWRSLTANPLRLSPNPCLAAYCLSLDHSTWACPGREQCHHRCSLHWIVLFWWGRWLIMVW